MTEILSDRPVILGPLLLCQSCKRITVTGLCGCPDPKSEVLDTEPELTPDEADADE